MQKYELEIKGAKITIEAEAFQYLVNLKELHFYIGDEQVFWTKTDNLAYFINYNEKPKKRTRICCHDWIY